MSTAINNNPANISTLAVQKTFQLIKALNDNNALSLEDKMIAIAESLNDLNARVNGLETPEYLPDIIANSIDTQEIPKIGGCSVIKTGDGAPTVATDFIGQVYIDTTNSKMYFAKAVGNSSNWVLPSTAVVTSWSSTPSNNNVPSEKLVKDSLDNKNAKVTGTSGNLAGFNNNGLLADSGISVSTSWSSSTGSDTKVASEKLVKGAVNDLITEIGNINAFEVATLTTGANPHPDVQSPSTKIIYLTKDSSSTATDPYTEWIYSNNTWEVIGETSMDLSGYKTKQSAVSDPTASGTSLTFISNITQNENGVISPSKKTIQDGTTSQKGVVQLEDSYSSTSTTKAATPNSVKAAYDLANNAIPSSSIATSWSSTTSDSKVPSEKLVKSSLDNKQGTLSFDGTYDASTNKVATVSTVTGAIGGLATVATSGSYSDLSNKPSIPAAQVNSDWNASSGVAQILHKPSLGTASAKDVPTSGDASSTQVVLGNDTRLNFENNKKYTVYNSSGDVYYYKVATITSTGPINIASGALFLIMTRDSGDNNYVYLAHIRKRDYHNDSAFIGSISKLLGGDFSTQSTIITFYVDKTSELSADFYIKLSGYCGMSVMPLTYGMAGQSSMVMTTASLPSTATEITPNMLPTVQFGGVGSASVPVYIDSYGKASACTLATVASTGDYNSLSGKPTLTNDTITLSENQTKYIMISYTIDASYRGCTLFTNLHIKGNSSTDNNIAETVHTIRADSGNVFSLTNNIISYNFVNDIEFSYYLDSYGILIVKLKNNTNSNYNIKISATALDSSDDATEYAPYRVLEITSTTTTKTQSGTVKNVWYNHAAVSEKIGKTNSATTGIDYTSLGDANTPVYLLNGEFKQCNTYSMPYEWVTTVPTNPVAGKIYLM